MSKRKEIEEAIQKSILMGVEHEIYLFNIKNLHTTLTA